MEQIATLAPSHVRVLLAGNKVDLPRVVEREEGAELAERYSALFMETVRSREGKDGCICAPYI